MSTPSSRSPSPLVVIPIVLLCLGVSALGSAAAGGATRTAQPAPPASVVPPQECVETIPAAVEPAPGDPTLLCRSEVSSSGIRIDLVRIGQRIVWEPSVVDARRPAPALVRLDDDDPGIPFARAIADQVVLIEADFAELASIDGAEVRGPIEVRGRRLTLRRVASAGGSVTAQIVDEGGRPLEPEALLTAVLEVRARLARSSPPVAVEPNWVYSLARQPPKPRPDRQRSSVQAYSRIGLKEAALTAAPSPTRVVALIDSGVSELQDELSRKQLELVGGSWQDVPGGKDATGHGTAVAAVIAAKRDDDATPIGVLGIAGLSPGTPLLSYETAMGSTVLVPGDVASSAILDAIGKADILVLPFNHSAAGTNVYQALRQAVDAGMLVITSLGNEARSLSEAPSYPASFAEAPEKRLLWTTSDWFAAPSEPPPALSLLNVGSTHVEHCLPAQPCYDDLLADSSNFSAKDGVAHLAAPGVDIRTLQTDGELLLASGTSMAAAMVAGAAAYVWDRRPGCTADQVRDALVENGHPLADAGTTPPERAWPAKRLDIEKALTALEPCA